MADGEAFFVGFEQSGDDRGVGIQNTRTYFEPDLPLSEGRAFSLSCPLMKCELAARREVVGQVRSLALSVESTGYRRAAALLLEVAHSIEEALIVERNTIS